MKHATSRLLFAYWDGLRGDRAAPERSQVEPGQIRHILADAFILGLEPDGRALFRLAGTRVCALFGRDLKGANLSDLWPVERRREAEQLLDIVANEGAGAVAGIMGETDLAAVIGLELVLLPLRHRGATNSRVLGALSPGTVPSWLGLAPVHSLEMRSLRVIGSPRSGPPAFGVAGPTAGRKRHGLVLLDGGLSR